MKPFPLLLLITLAFQAGERPLQAQTIRSVGGDTFEEVLLEGIEPDGHLRLGKTGIPRFHLRSLTSIQFGRTPQTSPNQATCHLAAGSVLRGQILRSQEDMIAVQSSLRKEPILLPLDSIFTIRFQSGDSLPPRKKKPIDDLLFLQDEGRLVPMAGLLESISAEHALFLWSRDQKVHTIPRAKIHAVRLAGTVPLP
ncbi:MAG: hypothetical protein QF645_13470, partial [Planctomycetota bacterium]|nr:hypothetical protein [Planctomycetota bacterium]